MLHPGGMAVIIPHELFHRQGLPFIAIVEEGGEVDLRLKGELIVRPPCQVMELVSDPPEV